MRRILAIVTALILYGSFYPWHFRWVNLPHNPFWMLAHAWPRAFFASDARDAAINLALYMPFGAFFFLSLRSNWSAAVRVAATVAAATCLSSAIEMTQLFDLGRNCSLFDVLCNATGAGLGIGLAISFPRAMSAAVRGVEQAGAFRASGSIALLYLWLGYLIFPLIPSLSVYPVRSKLQAFANPDTWLMRDFFESAAAWLAVGALLNRLVGRKSGAVLAVALLGIPLKILIAGRTATVPEVVGAAVGITTWMLFRNLKRPMLAAAGFSLAALLFAGLLPFRMVAAQPFSWMPFLALLSTSWESAFVVLLRKSFLYGVAIWFLNENGRGWLRSTLAVAFLLAVVEGTQVYLPGRTAEITDPVLALILGLVLMMLERQARESASVMRRKFREV